MMVFAFCGAVSWQTEGQVSQSQEDAAPEKKYPESQPQADAVLSKTLELIVNGPAFDAKIRQTVWATGREVVGVGTYEQAGEGSGAYNLQVTMHDGDGKHRLQQISDGKLAWTRTQIAGKAILRRVDVGRLDEWVQGANRSGISPRLIVGAWGEILSDLRRDYVLRVHEGGLKEQPMWIVSGDLREDRREQILADAGRSTWPMLHPTRVLVGLQRHNDPQTGFGQLLPVRIEYFSDPVASDDASVTEKRQGRMIALIEIYSIRPTTRPTSLSRFRFENLEADDFVDETDRYIKRYGVELTERQRLLLRR